MKVSGTRVLFGLVLVVVLTAPWWGDAFDAKATPLMDASAMSGRWELEQSTHASDVAATWIECTPDPDDDQRMALRWDGGTCRALVRSTTELVHEPDSGPWPFERSGGRATVMLSLLKVAPALDSLSFRLRPGSGDVPGYEPLLVYDRS